MTPADLAPIANHIWQSTLFAGAVWIVTLALRQNHAGRPLRALAGSFVEIPASLLAVGESRKPV